MCAKWKKKEIYNTVSRRKIVVITVVSIEVYKIKRIINAGKEASSLV